MPPASRRAPRLLLSWERAWCSLLCDRTEMDRIVYYKTLLRSLHWFHGMRRIVADREDFDADVAEWFCRYALEFKPEFGTPFSAYMLAKLMPRAVYIQQRFIAKVNREIPVPSLTPIDSPFDDTKDVVSQMLERELWKIAYKNLTPRRRQALVRKYMRTGIKWNRDHLCRRFKVGRTRIGQAAEEGRRKMLALVEVQKIL